MTNKFDAQVLISTKLDKEASVTNSVLETKSLTIEELRTEVDSVQRELNSMTERFNRKDKDAMQVGLKRDELLEMNKQLREDKNKAERENAMLKVQKEDLSVKVETLRG